MTLDLKELKKRLQPQSALALTLEPDRMALSVVCREGAEPQKSLSICIGAEDVFRNPEKAGLELASALDSAGIRERRCVVAIPPSWALSTSADLPEVTGEDLRAFFELRAEREFSVSVAELRLAHCPYSLPDESHRATLAAVPAKRLEAVDKLLAKAGCRAVSVSLALPGCLADPQAKLHFLAAGSHTDVIISAGGGIAMLRSLAGPRSTDEAPFDPISFCREIRITLGRLPESLRQTVRIARFSGDPAQELEKATCDFLQRMGIESQTDGAAPGTLPGAAVETAKRHLHHQPVAFEFVIVEPNRWPAKFHWFNTRRGRQITVAALALVLLPLVIFSIRSNMESNLETQWNGMKNAVTELDLTQQKIRTFHPWFDHTPQSLKVLESFVTGFPAQADVWAKTVQVGADYKITCSGFARNQACWIAFLRRLQAQPNFSAVQVQQTRGQNPIQFSLTCKWEANHDK
jgi:hypothetical protein